uniref:Uncharacterized protein n=1 Tax=Panagrolaimus sp. JU765 TaxID=591449 RepID=A0AC34Q7L7_9BILA
MSLNDLKTVAIEMVNHLEETLTIAGEPCHERTQAIINKIEEIVSQNERLIHEQDEKISRLQKEIEMLEEKMKKLVVGPDGIFRSVVEKMESSGQVSNCTDKQIGPVEKLAAACT